MYYYTLISIVGISSERGKGRPVGSYHFLEEVVT